MAIDTSGGTVFVGSKEKARDGYGQNGDPNASSVLPGKPIPHMGGITNPVEAAVIARGVAADDYQTRAFTAEQVVPTAYGMRNRNLNPEKVPSTLARGRR